MPRNGQDLIEQKHECLLLRFPGQREFVWTLDTLEGRGDSRCQVI